MSLTQKHLSDVCFLGGGRLECRYLEEELDDQGKLVYVCKKMSPHRKIIDEEVADFLNEMLRSGQDPNQRSEALGDNCQGYITLKSKPQGYDVKP